ncbi:hypothetical protein [Shewanella mangrovisoli]|uniref:SMODS and SLOG-associating 2TM effector domain-containing protein n=1 Tax=Shewanella mangrovisoli TaxID=2864211 RepID=A0ABV4VGS0_9GAMM
MRTNKMLAVRKYMQQKHLSFVLEEYKALRVEIDNIQKQGYAMETALILGIAGFVSFASSATIADSLIWYLPFLITLLVTAKKWFLSKRMEELGEYIARIEDKLKFANIIGWEHRLKEIRDGKWYYKKNWATYLFWFALCVFTLWYGCSEGKLLLTRK